MTQQEKRIYLIGELISEQPKYMNIEIPQNEQDQKRLLRSLMNVRPTYSIGEDFLTVQDAYLQEEIARNETVASLYEKLYEDNVTGKVSDEWFMQLSHKYEAKRLELKTKIPALRRRLAETGQQKQEREGFIEAVRQFMRMEHLTAPLLRELIDHIDVFETEGKGKSRTQRILIYYRFVGYIEMPAAPPRESYTADTRKGVAVSYLTDRQTA